MKTFFTSDLHFGHVNILKYTPQRRTYLGLSDDADVTDMNEAIVELWNRQVDADDEVFIVGDVAMGLVHDTIRYVSRLNGTKHLVRGNHDRTHPVHSEKETPKREKWEAMYDEVGLKETTLQFTHNFDGIEALVCHFPYYGDHSEDRYNADKLSIYAPDKDRGLPLVHGHVHDLWKTRDGIMYNVGIDAWDGVFQTPEAIGAFFRANGFTE